VQTIKEKIQQRRLQMLVHSYLYYEKNENIVPDSKWSKWAKELVDLQQKYPNESKQVDFYDMFKNWDGNSGAFLTYNQGIISRAETLLKLNKKSVKKSTTRRLF